MTISRRVFKEAGFTIVEVSFVVAIVAILAAFAMPFYRDYVERAHLAEVLVQYDAMREKVLIEAAEANADVCNWKGAQTSSIEGIVNNHVAALDADRWKTGLSHLAVDPKQTTSGPLTVQFGGIGAQGVHRVNLLAAEFQKMGVFNKWDKNTDALATFTVFLDGCKSNSEPMKVIASALTTAQHIAVAAPAVCSQGLVLDAAKGSCKPGCKTDEFEPVFTVNGGFTDMFNQPKNGPHTCFSKATDLCSADKPMPGIKNGSLVCDPMHGSQPAVAKAPKPSGCAAGGSMKPFYTEASVAQKFAYKAVDCGGQDPSVCEFMASPHGAVTCPVGSFPSLTLVNNDDGSRTMERSCMTMQQCQADFWRQSSQLEQCNTFTPAGSTTASFSCTYCCAGDNCNGFDLNPDGNKPDSNSSVCPINPDLLLHWD